jgi:hypothetical protein
MSNEKETVIMTAEEKAQFEAFKQTQAKKEAEAKKKRERDTYRQIVSETVDDVFLRFDERKRQTRQTQTGSV